MHMWCLCGDVLGQNRRFCMKNLWEMPAANIHPGMHVRKRSAMLIGILRNDVTHRWTYQEELHCTAAGISEWPHSTKYFACYLSSFQACLLQIQSFATWTYVQAFITACDLSGLSACLDTEVQIRDVQAYTDCTVQKHAIQCGRWNGVGQICISLVLDLLVGERDWEVCAHDCAWSWCWCLHVNIPLGFIKQGYAKPCLSQLCLSQANDDCKTLARCEAWDFGDIPLAVLNKHGDACGLTEGNAHYKQLLQQQLA